MINVLHVISDTNIGGAGVHLLSLVRNLDKKAFSIFIACPKGAQISELAASAGASVIEIGSMLPDESFNTGSLRELVSVIKQYRIDIVHTHASLSGRVAAKAAGVKIVYTRHTPGKIYKRGSIKWVLNKYLNLLLSDRVIAVSNHIAAMLKEMGIPDQKLTTIYNGIDPELFNVKADSQETRRKCSLADEFILLAVARLEEGKGHKYLFEAVSLIDESKDDIKLLVVGDGSQKQELVKLAQKLGIENKVIFTGAVNDVRPYFAVSDVVILPSLEEALGIVLLEGMCMEKPCIASKTGGIPEVVSDGISGILVEPGDVVGLKNAVIKLYENPDLRAAMGLEGKRIVCEKFLVGSMTRKIEELYFNLIKEVKFDK